MIIVSQPLLTFSTINQIAELRTFQVSDRRDPKLGFLPQPLEIFKILQTTNTYDNFFPTTFNIFNNKSNCWIKNFSEV